MGNPVTSGDLALHYSDRAEKAIRSLENRVTTLETQFKELQQNLLRLAVVVSQALNSEE